MKKIFAGTPHTKFIAAVSALTWTIAMANSAGAAQLQEARVTQVVNDVKLLLEQSAPRPAAISDLVRRGNAVRTGPQSRSELTFADLTITRLGANTIFSFKEGTREMNLIDGAILFQVPKGSGGATIRTVGVTAAITGTTGIAEFHPATTSHPQLSKWLCLEGTFHLYLPNGQSVELGPGKIVTSDGKSFSKVSTFDIAKLVSTSLFFTGFDQPLASMNLIMLESENQLASSLFATSTTNPLDPARIVNVTSQAIAAEETPTSPAASPTPPITPTPPSKFGTPSVISSPVPYLITNGTVITTDPSITTNSVTDYGKIYRGQTDDGAFSLWAFGSTSAFDTALRIDNIFFADPSHLPVAVFKFESLSLTGDPTIDTSNGVPKLALIGVDGITSGPPGGTLKFTGLDLLLLATVNGSINLTSDVSFQDLHELVMYARGAGSDLTINSPISNIGILGLVAEDSIHLTNPGTMSVGKIEMAAGSDLMLQIGGSLLLNGSMRLDAIVLPGASVASGVNLTLNVTGDYTNNSATASSQLIITNRDHIGGDASIAVGATNIFTANNLDVQIDNRVGGHIGENALVNVGVSGGDINIVGDATFQILNNFRGHIGRDANIFVTTGAGGDFTANSILALVNNHNGGAIGSGANLTFNIGGALVTQGDATFVISNLNEGPGGGTIGSLASLNMNAASISVGGFFQTFVGANGGGSIQGDAINTVNVSGDLTAQQGILVDIQDTGFNQINPTVFIAGGHIGGDATVTLAAQNIATSSTATGVPGIDTMALEASIYSDGSGTIGGNAIVNVLASQNISAPGTVFFGVANDNYQGFGGGTIGGDAQVNVTAGSLSTGALFDNIYNNGGGSIGRDAIISLNLSNGFTATGNAEFPIFNPGGIVARNASIAVNAGRMSAPSLSAEIDNSNGGNIGGNALINFDVSGDVTTQDDASFQILNGAGTIGGDVEISLTAANITANSLLAQIDNSNGGTIGGTAAINVSTTSANSLSANIDNSIGGTIGASANISLATGGDFATSVGDATFTINNTAGTITNNANLALNAGGSVSTAGELSLLLENYDESANPAGHIGGSANVSLITGENLTADFANIAINNRGGGRIDSGATLTIDIAGALTTLHNGLDFLGNPASLSLAVSNRGDNNTAGSFIGGDATLLFHSNSASIGGDLSVVISDKGGTIDGNALLNFSVTHDLTVQGESAATWQILTGDGPDVFWESHRWNDPWKRHSPSQRGRSHRPRGFFGH